MGCLLAEQTDATTNVLNAFAQRHVYPSFDIVFSVDCAKASGALDAIDSDGIATALL